MTLTTPQLHQEAEETKDQVVQWLNSLLFKFPDRKVKWLHERDLAFTSLTSYGIGGAMRKAQYGKIARFKFNILAHKADYAIIAYFKPGSGEYGLAVLDDDGDFCLEVTSYDLVHWIVDANVPTLALPACIAQLHNLVIKTKEMLPK
jgi:hypothetical protein